MRNGFRYAIITQPVGWKLQTALHTIAREHKVNDTAELVGDELANGVRPITGPAGSDDTPTGTVQLS